MPVSDPIARNADDLSDLNPHLTKEVEHFFQVYKDLEKKNVDINGWGDVQDAKKMIAECINRYQESNVPSSEVSI